MTPHPPRSAHQLKCSNVAQQAVLEAEAEGNGTEVGGNEMDRTPFRDNSTKSNGVKVHDPRLRDATPGCGLKRGRRTCSGRRPLRGPAPRGQSECVPVPQPGRGVTPSPKGMDGTRPAQRQIPEMPRPGRRVRQTGVDCATLFPEMCAERGTRLRGVAPGVGTGRVLDSICNHLPQGGRE